MLRTQTCGELNAKDMGKKVTLAGWVHTRRDHGDLIFIDLRDAYGLTQLVFDPKAHPLMHKKCHDVKGEYVIKAEGTVRKRPDGTINKKLKTGEIEVLVDKLEILNPSKTPPFEIDGNTLVSDEARLKYRYIDLRSAKMQKNMRIRHRITSIMRGYLEKHNFVEVETPFLTRSTPEGARDYLVPSRLNPGKFYALPQSPQLFKQILMVAGLDKYFQIVRCFRDEDLRKDRQPEFTQLDMEMSFVEEDDIFTICEGLLKEIFKDASGVEIKTPFSRLKHEEALERFGSDKPETRFGMELVNLTDIFQNTNFKVFKKNLEVGGKIYAINAKGYATISRSKLDGLIDKAKEYGAAGLAYFKCEKGKLASNIEKYFEKTELDLVRERTKSEDGDLILIVCDSREIALGVLGSLRLDIGNEANLIDEKKFDFTWIVDFPLFKFNKEENRWDSEHHPFTSCQKSDEKYLDTKDLARIRARSYDLVINGAEIASGSIRIHRGDLQAKIFKIIGLEKEEAKKRFGFLMEAFQYGAPPHGGIAFGLDRFVTLFTGSKTIRDVIAFPKTQKAVSLLTGAPQEVDEKQLRELHIKKAK